MKFFNKIFKQFSQKSLIVIASFVALKKDFKAKNTMQIYSTKCHPIYFQDTKLLNDLVSKQIFTLHDTANQHIGEAFLIDDFLVFVSPELNFQASSLYAKSYNGKIFQINMLQKVPNENIYIAQLNQTQNQNMQLEQSIGIASKIFIRNNQNGMLNFQEDFISELQSQNTKQMHFVDKTSTVNNTKQCQLAFDFYGNFAGIKLPNSNELVSAQHLQYIIKSFKKHNSLNKPHIGISAINTKDQQENPGIIITRVQSFSPSNGKLKLGDRIIQLNDMKIKCLKDFYRALSYRTNETIQLYIIRNYDMEKVDIKIDQLNQVKNLLQKVIKIQ